MKMQEIEHRLNAIETAILAMIDYDHLPWSANSETKERFCKIVKDAVEVIRQYRRN